MTEVLIAVVIVVRVYVSQVESSKGQEEDGR